MTDLDDGLSKIPISKKDLKLTQKFSYASLPVISFGKGMDEFEKITTELIIQLSKENACINKHLKKDVNDEVLLSHLYNTNFAMTHVLYLTGWLYHYIGHTLENDEHSSEFKETLMNLDQKFREHEPFLNHIKNAVKQAKEREEKAKHVYT